MNNESSDDYLLWYPIKDEPMGLLYPIRETERVDSIKMFHMETRCGMFFVEVALLGLKLANLLRRKTG